MSSRVEALSWTANCGDSSDITLAMIEALDRIDLFGAASLRDAAMECWTAVDTTPRLWSCLAKSQWGKAFCHVVVAVVVNTASHGVANLLGLNASNAPIVVISQGQEPQNTPLPGLSFGEEPVDVPYQLAPETTEESLD